MGKTFEEMNRSELIDSVKRLGLQDELTAKAKELNKKIATLKNAEVLEVLNTLKDSQDAITAEEDKAGNIEKIEINERPIDEIRQEFNEIRELVVVVDHETKVSSEESIEGRVLPVNISNNVLGRTTYNVKLNGEPQLLPHSVIRKLSRMDTLGTKTDGKTKGVQTTSRKRFSVAPAGELSKAQIAQIEKEQESRKGLNL